MSHASSDGHRPTLPIKGTRRRDDAHSRWPLPLSLVLAILLWVSLNDSVHEEETISCQVVVHDRGASNAVGVPGQIVVRLPDSRTHYTQSQILDPSHKLLNRKVQLRFAGPGRFVSDLERRLTVWAEVQIPEDGRDEFIYTFTKKDLRTDPSDLSPFLVDMDPKEINIKFVASGQVRINIHPDRVKIEYPEPEKTWKRRIFPDTMVFEPRAVTIAGPAKILEQFKVATERFTLDCRTAPKSFEGGNYKGDSPGKRPILSFDLDLLQKFRGLTMTPEVKVRMQVSSDPPRFPQGSDKDYYTIPVRADWYSTPLDPKAFEVSETMRIRIYSYDKDLSALLKKEGEAWVKRNLRATVDLGEIEGDYKDSQAFFKQLSPYFSNYDDSFQKGQDFRIEHIGLVQVKRR